MRTLLLSLLALFLLGCTATKTVTTEPTTFLLGTYDGDHDPGIYRFGLSKDGQLTNQGRVAEASNPSYLAFNTERTAVFAVEEVQEAKVIGFDYQDKNLTFVNRRSAGGANACHVSVGTNNQVSVSNYSSGTVTLLASGGGILSLPAEPVDHHRLGADKPHAHASYFLGKNSDQLIAVDLGTNQLWRYQLATKGLEPYAAQPTIDLKEGAGPRHMAFHPNGKWGYVINELNSTMTQIMDMDKDVFTVGKSWSTLPADFTGESFCADVHLSKDGRFLYGSNRGHNSIVVYEVDQQSGELTLVEHESVAGDWPRNFSLTPDERHLLVANQKSNSITVLARDAKDGKLNYVSKADAPTPVCILFE